MRFALLGPLTVTGPVGEQLAVPGPRQRVLLAVLLLHANKPVSAGELTEAIWDGAPGHRQGRNPLMQNHVMRLRRVLGTTVGLRLVTRAPGYLIEVRDGELDLRVRGAARGGGAARRAARWQDATWFAARAGALAGEPLPDCAAGARDGASRADQLRLQAMEDRLEAELRRGQHARMSSERRD